jgi:hypothetical protein
MRRMTVTGGIVLGAFFVLAGAANAQVKGTGKLGLTIIATPNGVSATANAKAAGSIASKARATVIGKPPTGGAITTLKLAKDLGDPLKPGFAPGTYLLEIESGATATADAASASGSTVFAQITVDALGKCTIKAHDNVDGDGNNDLCTVDVDCAPSAVGKCSITSYQLAGAVNYLLGPGTAQPTAGRFRIRKGVNVSGCNTGDILLGGAPLFGGTTCHDPANIVVGVMGVANGDIN